MDHPLETESDVIAEIERLELQARELHESAKRAKHEQDRVVLYRQRREIEDQVDRLRERVT